MKRFCIELYKTKFSHIFQNESQNGVHAVRTDRGTRNSQPWKGSDVTIVTKELVKKKKKNDFPKGPPIRDYEAEKEEIEKKLHVHSNILSFSLPVFEMLNGVTTGEPKEIELANKSYKDIVLFVKNLYPQYECNLSKSHGGKLINKILNYFRNNIHNSNLVALLIYTTSYILISGELSLGLLGRLMELCQQYKVDSLKNRIVNPILCLAEDIVVKKPAYPQTNFELFTFADKYNMHRSINRLAEDIV